jgi:hypothetical protein
MPIVLQVRLQRWIQIIQITVYIILHNRVGLVRNTKINNKIMYNYEYSTQNKQTKEVA